MKKTEKDAARLLREEGMSMNEIVKKLGVAKSSVSLWVRDIELSEKQREKISRNGRSVDSIEKRRINRIENTHTRHQIMVDKAKAEILELSKQELRIVGAVLYWGEGGKTVRSTARISNADPKVIQTMMRFFKEICDVPKERFRGHVHTFSHLNSEKAEKYWSEISGIPRKQFYKTYSKPSIASKGKKDSLPYGTFQIYVCDTTVFLKIKGWIERIYELAVPDELV